MMTAFKQSFMETYLKETKILDYTHPSIQELVERRQWKDFDTTYRIKGIYNFVRDEIKFGYNISDDIPASQILKDEYGQCNTKETLLINLLRKEEILKKIKKVCGDIWLSCLSISNNKKECKMHPFLKCYNLLFFTPFQSLYF